jgi:TIR domain
VQDRPLLFVAFSHNQNAKRIADKLKLDLRAYGVEAYRAMDDPRPGESLTEKIHGAIERSDAVVFLWTRLASESEKVRDEYRHTLATGRKPCLIRFEGVPLPDGWNEDTEWVAARGVTLHFLGPAFWPREWDSLVKLVAEFARREAARRRQAL